MKFISRSACLMFAVLVLLCLVPQARAEIIVMDPEQTETFTLTFSGACAIEGEIIFSDPSIITNIQYNKDDCAMTGELEDKLFFFYSDDPNGVDGEISVTLTVYSDAPKGSSCSVIFLYSVTEAGSDVPGPIQTLTYTITVRTDGGDTQPSQPGNNADTSVLRQQIQIAEKLTYYDFTKQSWAEVDKALTKGRKLLSSSDQAAVDSAAYALKAALANLVPMDYSALLEALDNATDMSQHDDIAEYWNSFVVALQNARAQRTSGDQEAVDKAVEELIRCKDELRDALERMGDVIVLEKEVKVEVEPSYAFCNKMNHTTNLVIMIVSVVLNVALIGLIALYFYKKYMKERDNTPLVAYDIDTDLIGPDGEIQDPYE